MANVPNVAPSVAVDTMPDVNALNEVSTGSQLKELPAVIAEEDHANTTIQANGSDSASASSSATSGGSQHSTNSLSGKNASSDGSQPSSALGDGIPAHMRANDSVDAKSKPEKEDNADEEGEPQEVEKTDVEDVPPKKALLLVNGYTTLSRELDGDRNAIALYGHVDKHIELVKQVLDARPAIAATVLHHLGLGTNATCTLEQSARVWKRGSFNMCMSVKVESPGSLTRSLIFRWAMPFKLAEELHPGSVDEKMASEVGTYAWMQEHCRDVPVPHLYGFGFLDRRQYTHEAQRPWYTRWAGWLRRCFARLTGSTTLISRYTRHQYANGLPIAYMLLEDVSTPSSKELWLSYRHGRHDLVKRSNLFRGMARTMISLARIPQPRIGSLEFRHNGSVTLTNRPLSSDVFVLENDGAPRVIKAHTTYDCTEAYVADALRFHEERFRTYRNATSSETECREEMSSMVMLRALAHNYIMPEHRYGPFALRFDDMHGGNIFVDDEWNITSLCDLEWVLSAPIEDIKVPFWLSATHIGDLEIGQGLIEYQAMRQHFLEVYTEEELRFWALRNTRGRPLAPVMKQMWESGGTWFWLALSSTNGAVASFSHHLCDRFLGRQYTVEEDKAVSQFWTEKCDEEVARKVCQYEEYETELRALFDAEGVMRNKDGSLWKAPEGKSDSE